MRMCVHSPICVQEESRASMFSAFLHLFLSFLCKARSLKPSASLSLSLLSYPLLHPHLSIDEPPVLRLQTCSISHSFCADAGIWTQDLLQEEQALNQLKSSSKSLPVTLSLKFYGSGDAIESEIQSSVSLHTSTHIRSWEKHQSPKEITTDIDRTMTVPFYLRTPKLDYYTHLNQRCQEVIPRKEAKNDRTSQMHMYPKVRILWISSPTLASHFEMYITSIVQASEMSQLIKVPVHKSDNPCANSRTHVKIQIWNPVVTLEVETGQWAISLQSVKAGVHNNLA